MAELIIILIVVACIAWVAWTVREFKLSLKDAGFVEACGSMTRHYTERQHLKSASVWQSRRRQCDR